MTVLWLLACDWGRRVGLPGDNEPCAEQAVQRVALHDPHAVLGGRERLVQLCGQHFAIVQQQTDPHAEVQP